MPNDNWRTPKWLFNYAQDWIGEPFALDAAADESNFLCKYYYTKYKSGLNNTWCNPTWCNPPYSKEAGPIRAWVDHAINQYDRFLVKSALLLPADTATLWFGKIANHFPSEIHLIGPRVAFLNEDGNPVTGNRFGSMLAFIGACADRGKTYQRLRWVRIPA